jgi:predicted nucleotidyltransferase
MQGDKAAPVFGRSATRRDVLRYFFAEPGRETHVRELARRLGRPAAVVGRELARLEEGGILASTWIGRSRRYRVDEASPLSQEVRGLVQKTIGVEQVLRDALERVSGVEEAFLFGSYAAGTERPASDLDVLLIGRIDQVALSERLQVAEQALGREVNAVADRREEFEDLARTGDAFLTDVIQGPRVALLAGSEA